MYNNLIFIAITLHPSTSLHLLLFYPILSSIAQLYIQSFMFQIIIIFFCLFIFIYVYFLFSFIFIVCVSMLSL